MTKTQPVRRHFTFTIKDFYAEYRKEKKKTMPCKDIRPFKQYKPILEDWWEAISKKIIYENFTFMMPYSLGSLHVKAYKMKNLRKRAKIDYNLTKQIGKVVRHINTHSFEHFFGVKWDKSYVRFKNNSLYKFTHTSSQKATDRGIGKRGLGQHIRDRSKDQKIKSYIKI